MIALLARAALAAGVPQRFARAAAWIAIVVAIALIIVAGVAIVRRGGERAGAAKVTATVQRDHAARVIEARTDERAAADVSHSIAVRVERADAAVDAHVQSTIKDLRDALAAVPPASAGAPLPAAPVDSLRDHLNAGIDRANRAAEAAGTLR